LYRSPFLEREEGEKKKYYETSSLRFYREKLEEKAAVMTAQIFSARGDGSPINLGHKNARNAKIENTNTVVEKAAKSGVEFLEQYRSEIAALPEYNEGKNYFGLLNDKEKQAFTTLLPLAAAIKYRNPALKTKNLIEETRRYCLEKIDKHIQTLYINNKG
jgi:hypothetical protein